MMDMEGDGLSELLQQAQQLSAQMDTGLELPKVQRNLRQVSEMANRMAARAHGVGQDSTVKASLLLGSKGYDVQQVSKLEGLSSAKTFEPLEPVKDTDIQKFLKNERENALLSAIEQARKHTFEETERRHWEKLESEWDKEKQRILNVLVGGGQSFTFVPETEVHQLSTTFPVSGRSNLDHVETAYIHQVVQYNERVIQGGVKPSLTDMCSTIGTTLDDQNVMELWSMVKSMVNVSAPLAGSIAKARLSYKLQSSIVTQALKYLEDSYRRYMSSAVYSDLQRAQLGGKPGTYNLVRSYLKVRQHSLPPGLEQSHIDGVPLWALIYYCIRCGDMAAAQQVVTGSQGELEDLPKYFDEYSSSNDRKLTSRLEREIRLSYRRHVRHCADPFKRAVYCLLGRCDPREDHADIAATLDDYLWFKLSQIQFDDDLNASVDVPATPSSSSTSLQQQSGKYTLEVLQKEMLEEYGETHFNAYQQPLLFFRVLFLTGHFEAGLEFLSRMESLRCHAVHIALALQEAHLLVTTRTSAQLLNKSDMPYGLNIARLVTMYTRKFESTDCKEALHYYYFLRDVKTTTGESLFMSCVSELVLETREFEQLLGQLTSDGTRRPGAVDFFKGDTQKIIDMVAKDTESKGLLEEAVKLYDLGKNAEKVLDILNKLLIQVLSQPPTPQSSKHRVKQLAERIATRYRDLGIQGSPCTTSTFYLLLDLVTFFDLCHGQQVTQAYEVIKNLRLLPLTEDEVKTKVASFQQYSDEVRRSLPEILLATMRVLSLQYRNAKTANQTQTPPSRFGTPKREDANKAVLLDSLKTQARALITFAGMIPYRMPGDTNARLVQMEVSMS